MITLARRVAALTLLLGLVVACSQPTALPEPDSGAAGDAAGAAADADAPSVRAGVSAGAEAGGREGGVVDIAPLATETPSVTETPAPTEIPDPIGVITDTATYVDATIGYAIDYPASWTLDAIEGSQVTMTSYDPATTGGTGLLPGQARVEIVPDLLYTDTSLDEMVAATRLSGAVLDEETRELADGIPAVRLLLTGPIGGEMLQMLTVINDRGLRVQGLGDLALFDPIARTLRPAP
jgi:hypothetical protein